MSRVTFEKYTKEDGSIGTLRCYDVHVSKKSYDKYLKAISPHTDTVFSETSGEFSDKIYLEIPLNDFYMAPEDVKSKNIPSSLQSKILKAMNKYEAELLHVYLKD